MLVDPAGRRADGSDGADHPGRQDRCARRRGDQGTLVHVLHR